MILVITPIGRIRAKDIESTAIMRWITSDDLTDLVDDVAIAVELPSTIDMRALVSELATDVNNVAVTATNGNSKATYNPLTMTAVYTQEEQGCLKRETLFQRSKGMSTHYTLRNVYPSWQE